MSRIRLISARRFALALASLSRTAAGLAIIKAFRGIPMGKAVLDQLVGFRRIFPSLAQASACASRYLPGHEHLDSAIRHLATSETARPSDYPVIFHLSQILRCPKPMRLFDLGGNAGNLFYCFREYFPFPPDFTWIVQDIPPIVEFGRELAESRKAMGVQFTTSFEEVDDADILLASGSLHYFERPLPHLLRELGHMPRHVIINRTPLGDGAPFATVQDAGSYLTVCNIFNKSDFIADMLKAGYNLKDSWSVPELSVQIPCYPERAVSAYSGLYFFLDSMRRRASALSPLVS